MISLIFAALLTEALVELFFHAGPLQPLRAFLRRITPFLYSKRLETHLFDCPYCISLWAGVFAGVVVSYCMDLWFAKLLVSGFVCHRVSNYLHAGVGYVQDLRIDLRVRRNEWRND